MGVSMSKDQVFVMDREAWRAAIHGVAKSRTWLSDWTEHSGPLFAKVPLRPLVSSNADNMWKMLAQASIQVQLMVAWPAGIHNQVKLDDSGLSPLSPDAFRNGRYLGISQDFL